ncbi:hypothetical protein M0802_005548 [Mischocyttarus mexicanus]|nr:hypothetical protein M0802_005548 [Mischocyttarus mexicanus]
MNFRNALISQLRLPASTASFNCQLQLPVCWYSIFLQPCTPSDISGQFETSYAFIESSRVPMLQEFEAAGRTSPS